MAEQLPEGPTLPARYVRPDDLPTNRACSFTRPVCVHAPPGSAPELVLNALGELETADARLVDVLGFPRPLEDGPLGGGPEFDLYLVDPGYFISPGRPSTAPDSRARQAAPGRAQRAQSARGGYSGVAARTPSEPIPAPTLLIVERDTPRPYSWDSASAFGVLDRRAGGCVASSLIARAYATSIGWRVDAAELPSIREARAAYLAELVAPCGAVSSELLDEFQSHPERAVCDGGSPSGPATGFMFPWFLDTSLGANLGQVSLALSAIGPQRTPPGNWAWVDEPDLFDSLRATMRARPSPHPVSDLLLDFAVARLFWGDRDDGAHVPAAAFSGSFGRVRFDWSLPFSTLPRRVMPAHAIEPTGTTYVWVDLAGAPPGARLEFRAEWETPVVFRWALVRIGLDGRELSRVLVTPQAKSTSAERNVEDIDGLAGIAVVGVNSGDNSESEPFDPDQVPFEPHACAITLAPGQ